MLLFSAQGQRGSKGVVPDRWGGTAIEIAADGRHTANIEHYRAMLKGTTYPVRRRMNEKLLLEEEAKLKKYEDHKKKWSDSADRYGRSRRFARRQC
jgi:hypothetical protein